MRRFLNRSSTASRLVAVLTISVVIPGLMLAGYGVQAVLQEDELYRATLRTRAEEVAAGLARDLSDRMTRTLTRLDEATTPTAAAWSGDPEAAAHALREAEPLVLSVLVLGAGDNLRFPRQVASGLVDRIGGESAARASLPPLVREGERLELAGRHLEAATVYEQVLASPLGQRGRAVTLLARARSLHRAGRHAEALAAWDELAANHPEELDLNDVPVAGIAGLQGALALTALERQPEAADRLASLLDRLLAGPGTYGGHGETAIAWRAIALLQGGLAAQSTRATPLDLEALTRRARLLADRQAEQALVLDLLPALRAVSFADGRGPEFKLQPMSVDDRTLLFAHAHSDRVDGARHLLLQLDDHAVRSEVLASVATTARARPEFQIELVRGGGPPPEPEATGFRVVRVLSPFLPGYALVVSGSDDALAGPSRRQQRVVRLGMIGGLFVIIIVGIGVIGRAVNKEMEIARLKSDFVSNVSHELRTPLTTIRIMAEMLALGAVPPGPKQQEYYRNIVSESERLSRLINNVLDFARIEEGRKKFNFGLGDLGDAIFEVERITGDYVRSEGFELSCSVDDDLPATAFDRDAIIQALINLMSNAVKYSKQDRRIEMGARCDRDNIVVWVADHGPGIDAKDLPHLFEKFYRGGDHMTREVRGAGLGLSIVHHIVSAHRGQVSVHSKLGEGSTFEIVLPVSTVADLSGAEGLR